MMKEERCPLKTVRFNKAPINTRINKESSTIPQVTQNAFLPKNAGAMNATTAMRAVHGTSGARIIVNNLDDHESITRVPITAGTLQPKPRNNGKKDLPCSPMRCMKLSIT